MYKQMCVYKKYVDDRLSRWFVTISRNDFAGLNVSEMIVFIENAILNDLW